MLALASILLLAAAATSAQEVRAACRMAYAARVDAFDESFDISECEARGHCWQRGPPGTPWCFFANEVPGVPSTEECAAAAAGSRRECAASGDIDAASCAERYCCWAPGEPDQPWCFHPSGSGYYEEEDDYDHGEEM